MTREELKKSVKVLKKSAKDTVGNREKNNKFTIIADIKPDSFDYIMSQVIEALSEPTRPRAIDDTLSRKIYNNAETKDIYSLDGTVSTMLVIGVDTVMDIIADYLKGGDSDA